MRMLQEYFKQQQKVFDYFGYVEDWVAIPLDDRTEFVWQLYQEEDGSGFVRFAETVEELLDEQAGQYYENEIYRQRFFTKVGV